MKDRRSFLRMLALGVVALGVVVAPAIADELFGVITKVDVEGKKLTVAAKGSEEDVIITVTDDTEVVTKKGSRKADLDLLAKGVEKAKEKGARGIPAKITHEKNVASKISPQFKKKADN
jgi:hypothetical protein